MVPIAQRVLLALCRFTAHMAFVWPERPSADPNWYWCEREGFPTGKWVLNMSPVTTGDDCYGGLACMV